MKKYEVQLTRIETIVYYVTVFSENPEEAEDIAREKLENNNWECERKGFGGNCIDAEEYFDVEHIEMDD